MPITSLTLPPDIEKRLNALAEKSGRSKIFYIIEAVSEYLDEMEDITIAEQRLANLRAGHSKILSSEENA